MFFITFFIIKNVYKTSFYNTKRPFVLNPVALIGLETLEFVTIEVLNGMAHT